jgi:hypothetical protein
MVEWSAVNQLVVGCNGQGLELACKSLTNNMIGFALLELRSNMIACTYYPCRTLDL